METPIASTYQFGPFEVNASSGELLKQGRRVKLQEQPFRLLVILLENGGHVVSREEIRLCIWQENTFGDFDSSLRVAVRKLRNALGDDAEDPRYIETVPKRGYRFLAPTVQPANPISQFPHFDKTTVIAETDSISGSRTRGFNTWLVGAVVLTLICIAIAAFHFATAPRSVLSEKDTLVLADFANSTGDPVFEETLRQGMAVQLEQSPFLSLVSDERIQQTLRQMGRPADASLTPEIAREICERTASAAVLEGSIANMGSQYVLGLRAKDCRTGDILDEEQAQAARKEDILKALSLIAAKLRNRVGESLSTIEEHDTPLAEATTPSLGALKAYSNGIRVMSSSGSAAALPFFKSATEIDPKFAMAYAYLGRVYGDIGESLLSAEGTSKAYDLRDRTSDREKFFIAASYDVQVTGDLEKAQHTCELWAQTYPREMLPHALLAGLIYQATGQYERAVKESTAVIKLDPDFAIGYDILAYSYESLGQVDKAENALQIASERKLEIPWFLLHRYRIAFFRADSAEMERIVTQASGSGADEIANQQAFVFAYRGQLRQAKKMSERAAELALQNSQRETAALWKAGGALQEALWGYSAAARRSAMASLELSTDREVEYGSAIALAFAGDSTRSETLANDLERRFPEDTSVRLNYLPTLRAQLALNHGQPLKAIELLKIAMPYELGVPGCSIHGFFGALYPVYVRGEAYLAAHQGTKAAAEYQKILDHRGIVVSDPIGVLAHLQLSRALASSKDRTNAKVAYQDFLMLSKDADPEIPILKRARAEYVALK